MPLGSTFVARWRGAELMRRVRSASIDGIDDVMKASTLDAKNNHPGWKNITTNAERSMRIVAPAKHDIRGAVGRWGSTGVRYMLSLEYNRGSALRMAAQENYPSLGGRIAFYFRGIV